MKGTDLAAARQRLGLTVEELAAVAGVTPECITAWEASEVPAADALQLDRRLWFLEMNKTLSECPLPECEWTAWWAAQPKTGTTVEGDEVVHKHMEGCPVCQARMKYIQERLRPMPQEKPGPFEWFWAMVVGAAIILLIGGGV